MSGKRGCHVSRGHGGQSHMRVCYTRRKEMKNLKKCLIGLLLFLLISGLAAPLRTSAATGKYGVIIGDKNNNYQLVNNLVVVSPENNLMVKAYSLCKRLGLPYSYNSETKKLIIQNPGNGKSVVYTMDKKNYIYYSGKGSKGAVKTAAYKFYYDSASKSYVVHMSTLKYLLTYNYYNALEDTYYARMGYKALIAYSINGYSSYDIPVTEELINFINAKTFATKEELLDAVRLNMIAHKTGITLQTYRGVMDAIGTRNSIYDLVSVLDSRDTSKDADYLRFIIDHFSQSWRSTSTVVTYPDGSRKEKLSEDDPASLTINIEYETPLTQERVVDSKIASILKELKLEGASDYEKVKKIHDYIINLAGYDTTYERSSAYNLLVDKTAVCEGYALAAYRLLTDAGLECKIISGYGKGESHAWNLVKVDGEWYNLDLTWDDPITSTGKQLLRYDYFLKNDEDFEYHDRDPEYSTAAFARAYPMAEESYEIQ
jgi:hypothetical protein